MDKFDNLDKGDKILLGIFGFCIAAGALVYALSGTSTDVNPPVNGSKAT